MRQVDKQLEKELDRLRAMKLVSLRKLAYVTSPVRRVIRVGIPFRTDGSGKAHTENDCAAIEGLNRLKKKDGTPMFSADVVPVTLPLGASGPSTPHRYARWSDLDHIDLLYIAGGPTANDTQEASSDDPALAREEREFATKKLPVRSKGEKEPVFLERMAKYLRENGEHVSRAAYELRLLGFARNRGIPVLAVCAGSWRLLESYNGKVRTLEVATRNKHKAANVKQTWQLENALRLVGGKNLVKLMTAKGFKPDRLTSVTRTVPEIRLTAPDSSSSMLNPPGNGVHAINSTHWAVASTHVTPVSITLTNPEGSTRTLVSSGLKLTPGAELRGRTELGPGHGDPSDWLEISAMDGDTDTVEAFESLYGAPTMGIQWHPETYMPGMLGEGSGSEEARELSASVFEFMIFAAQSCQQRNDVVLQLGGEGRAFNLMRESLQAMIGKRPLDAISAYRRAVELLPVEHWTARLVILSDAVKLLEGYAQASVLNPVAAFRQLAAARQKALECGVAI
jgi:putative glutamine amidotransferase